MSKRRNRGRDLARPGRVLLRVVPPARRDWARALLAELEQIEKAPAAARWVLGSGSLVARGLLEAITGNLGGQVMKTVLATLSIINIGMGIVLAGLVVSTRDTPVLVLGLGAGLVIQGGYTVAFMAGLLDGLAPWSGRALLVGQTVALLVGFFGFVSSALYNIDPPRDDYEYGPLAVGALIAIQAAVTLWLYAVRPGSERAQARHS